MASDLDIVRLKVGDTDASDQLLLDSEITALLTLHGTVAAAAPAAAEAIAAKFARGYNFKTDGQEFSRSDRVKHYLELAKRLRSNSGLSTATVTKVDGYSDDLSTRDGAAQASRTGRVRAGYYDGDIPH